MAEETLKLTSRGRWEKILAGSYGWLFFLAMFTSSLLQQDLGFWGSTAIGVASLGLGALLLVRLAAPERKYVSPAMPNEASSNARSAIRTRTPVPSATVGYRGSPR